MGFEADTKRALGVAYLLSCFLARLRRHFSRHGNAYTPSGSGGLYFALSTGFYWPRELPGGLLSHMLILRTLITDC